MEDLLEASEEKEKILCPSCLHPHDEILTFCENCGAPFGSLSTVGPLERIYAEGAAYRQAVSGPRKPIVLVGMWVISLPGALMLPLSIWFTFEAIADGRGWGDVGFAGLAGVISSILLYRTTANFIRKGRLEHSEAGDEGEELSPS